MTTDVRVIERANGAALRLAAATNDLGLLPLITPTALAAHREHFLRTWEQGHPVDPVLAYRSPDSRAEKAAIMLRNLRTDLVGKTDPWHQMIVKEAEFALEKLDAYSRHDAERITALSLREHGHVDDALLTEARRQLAVPRPDAVPDSQTRLLSAEDAAFVLSTALTASGLRDWTVRVDADMAARMSVRVVDHLVKVRRDAAFEPESVEALVVHEIGSHVFRYVNCIEAPALFGHTLVGNTKTDEGLAIWNELHVASPPGAPPDRRLALRVIAVHAALTGSFCDVVASLTPFVSVTEAFDITVRVKRGSVETSGPGGYLKDHVYLAGLRMIDAHLKYAPQDYKLLMSAKWPLEHVAMLRAAVDAGLLTRSPRLPDERFVAVIREAVSKRLR